MAPTEFDFGDELVNVRDALGFLAAASLLPPSEERIMARDITARLQALINTRAAFGSGHLYLYFPPGRYPLGRPVARTGPPPGVDAEPYSDLVVPPEVTLWFAPGAVLAPLQREPVRADLPDLELEGDRVYVEIQGDILAELQPIFDVIEVTPGGALEEAGRILLTGNRIREVYPEWWGAASGPFVGALGHQRNRIALQAAIDAAYHNRVTPRRNARGSFVDASEGIVWNRRPSIPVVLRGNYLVDGGIYVGDAGRSLVPAARVPVGGFELRGDVGFGGPGSLQAAAPSGFGPPQSSLLVIRGPVSFDIRNVVFNANIVNRGCVTIEPVVAEWGYSSFEGCQFQDCLHQLVHLDAETSRTAPGGHVWTSKRDFWNLTFTRCQFVPQPEPRLQGTPRAPGPLRDGVIANEEGNLIAIDATLGDNEGLELRDCFFAQAASPAIRAVSGRFALNECNFHILPPPFDPARNPEAKIERLNAKNDSSHGTDIVIVRPERPRSGFPGRVVPATFTARECETHSVQFLATTEQRTEPGLVQDASAWGAGSDERRSAVILLNVVSFHEEEDPTFLKSGRTEPPRIFWGYPGHVGCPLVMIGCLQAGFQRLTSQFTTRVVEPANPATPRMALRGFNRGVVYYELPLNGDIYDVASNVLVNDPRIQNNPGRTVFSIDPESPGMSASLRVRRLNAIGVLGELGTPGSP